MTATGATLLAESEDSMNDSEGLRDKLARSSEDALGKLAQDLLENPIVNSRDLARVRRPRARRPGAGGRDGRAQHPVGGRHRAPDAATAVGLAAARGDRGRRRPPRPAPGGAQQAGAQRRRGAAGGDRGPARRSSTPSWARWSRRSTPRRRRSRASRSGSRSTRARRPRTSRSRRRRLFDPARSPPSRATAPRARRRPSAARRRAGRRRRCGPRRRDRRRSRGSPPQRRAGGRR